MPSLSFHNIEINLRWHKEEHSGFERVTLEVRSPESSVKPSVLKH
jgi:hypothetical protein